MTKDYYIGLLIKRAEGSLEIQESDKLDSWINSSDENAAFAREYIKSWQLSSNYILPFDLNEENAFHNITEKINNTSKNRDTKIISLKQKFFKPMMAAASLFLISVLVWWLYSSNQYQTVIAKNKIENVKLPDGSKVWLNKHSQISFPKSFSNDRRLIKLAGEAFFEVQRDTTLPFVIEAKNAFVTVLGTSFNVKSNDNLKTVIVTVRTGKVKLESIENNKNIILTPNQKGTLDVKTGDISITEDKNLNSLAWKRTMLIFKDTPLVDLIKDLEQTFGVEIKLGNSEVKNCPFSGRYSTHKDIADILDDISMILKMEKVVKLSKEKYLLKGGICK